MKMVRRNGNERTGKEMDEDFEAERMSEDHVTIVDEVLKAKISRALLFYSLKGYLLMIIGVSLNVLWVYLLQNTKHNIVYSP